MRLLIRFIKSVLQEQPPSAISILKTTSVILLLICFLFDPLARNFTWLHYRKVMVKKEVQRQIDDGMDKNKLVVFKFSQEDTKTKLRWEQASEFEYNHKMYDVVETEIIGDAVYYQCWYDHEETMLISQLEELACQVMGNNPAFRIEGALLEFFSESLYCLFSFDYDIPVPELLNKQSGLFSYLFSQILLQPPKPPPQSSLKNHSFFM
jgi:hypothetical protein